MSRWYLFESKRRIIVKVIRNKLHGIIPPIKIIIYSLNLGRVSKEIYEEVELIIGDYIAKNRKQLVRENEEFLIKTKKLEVC